MFSPEQLNALIKEISSRMGGQQNCSGNKACNGGKGGGNNAASCGGDSTGGNQVSITPSQAMVIAGIVGGVLSVESILIDKDQTVQILLEGSLKRKTELDKMLDKIGTMNFDDVLKAILERY